MSKILKARSVLAVKNLAITTRFFVDVLGFDRNPIDADGWSFLSRDGFAVMLGECADAMPAGATGDHSYFINVLVDDIDALHAEFSVRGAPDLSAPLDQPWGLREFRVTTPDGHRMMFAMVIDG
jgi:uncharacterized glyoxalase superfamily protein PhnB